MSSVWEHTARLPSFAPLTQRLNVDVLIIGGGMAGILCAHFLQKAGVRYALVEADRLFAGVSQNTTAKLTSQHGLLYARLLSKLGPEKTGLYLQANQDALADYRAMAKDVECDFSSQDSFVYSLDDRAKIENELNALHRLGFPAAFADDLPLPLPVAGAVRFPDQAQFHPVKFAAGIVKNLRVYEHSPVRGLSPSGAITDRGMVNAKQIIVATHFPFLNKHGAFFLKLYQHRSYVLALENAPDVNGMYVDEAQNGLSFRNQGHLLLLGGGGHRTGKAGGGWQELRSFAARHYPQADERYRWAAQDCMSLDGLPYVGRYAKSTPNLWVATGFNKWGMTSSMAAARLLADGVLGKENPYAALYAPSRSLLHPQLALNGLEALSHLLRPSPRRCPHMGCALTWNQAEHSWDCACHGSRFAKDGQLLDNPATGDLPKKKEETP